MTRKEALDRLYDSDHAMMRPGAAYEIADALGIDRKHVPAAMFIDTRSKFKGLTVAGGSEGDRVKGVDAADLAEELCRAVGITPNLRLMGRGSRLRSATGFLAAHFEPRDNEAG